MLQAMVAMASAMVANAGAVIAVPVCSGDATREIQAAIDSAASFNGSPVTIRLFPGDYNISRAEASRHLYHISNTASAEENPDQAKHIGLWLKNLRNVTFDGNGAWLVTHGEMTSVVVDSCDNIVLKNFTLTAADPSVPEIKILSADDHLVTFEVIEPSQFVVEDGYFHFKGENWIVADGGRLTSLPEHAQVFYPERNVTLRCDSPLKGYTVARQLDGRTVQMEYEKSPDVHPGEHYQIRHGIRNEACGFINRSSNVELRNIEFNFMGNFGLVGQYSENITYDNIRCRPRLGSERTNAGFADFVQMSGCKGNIRIVNSIFEGSHDDPINIHGTHLKAVASDAPDRLTVRFMHGQTYGFDAFSEGDQVEIVDRHTLNPIASATVKAVTRIDDYNFELTLNKPLPALPDGYAIEDVAVENITWTPDVEISNNYFARTPTRGVLITTRGKSLIQDNVFFRMPMSAILVSDDARGWYESGPIHDLTIRRNLFVECSSPVISVSPEIDRFDKPVHKNIVIEANRFLLKNGAVVEVKASDNVVIRNNIVSTDSEAAVSAEKSFLDENVSNLEIDNNPIIMNQ